MSDSIELPSGEFVPIQDTVCECGHWYEEHDCAMGDDPVKDAWCAVCECPSFLADPEASTPQAIADRGGDPDLWPEHVTRGLA